MGVNISTRRDSVNCSVDNGGEHIKQSEGDSNPIREKESIENSGSLEVVNPSSEWSSSFEQGFHQIKERSLSLQPSTSQLDPKEMNHNRDDKSKDLIENHNESEETKCATKVLEIESTKDPNAKTSLMKNVFSMLGISKKTLTPEDINNTPTKLDEVLPENQNLSSTDSVTELSENVNDESKTEVSKKSLLGNDLKRIPFEQNSEGEQKNLIRITGEFPRSVIEPIISNTFHPMLRLHCKTYSEEARIRSAWFKKDLTNSLTIQQIYLAQPRSSPQKR